MTEGSEQDPVWSVGRVLRFATEDFQGRGVESPRLEAELLLGSVLGLDRVGLLIQSARPLTEDELKRYRKSIQRRREGEPVAYILGKREFFGMNFTVDRHVLVPRPETELLVEEALRRTEHRPLYGRALDLCTGSGCIAISFASMRKTWQTFGADISPEALRVARDNALHLGAVWNLSFHEGDLFEAVASDAKFELVVSNPPYIERAALSSLPADVRDFEPTIALDGGPDGLDFYRRLAEQAPAHLVPGGVLALEIGSDQASAVQSLLEQRGFFDLRVQQDFAGHDRVISGKRALSAARNPAAS
jgi:release factor glutamine methyltransferase